MRISSSSGPAHTTLRSDAQASRLSAAGRRDLYQRVLGAPGGAIDAVKPNREFEDLWLRFVSSVAQQGGRGTPALNAQTLTRPSVAAAARALASQAGPLVGAAFAARDACQIIDQVNETQLGGAAHHARYRTLAEAGGAILEWLARHGDAAHAPDGTDVDLLAAVDRWLAVTGAPDAEVGSFAQPRETVAAWSRYLHAAVGLEEDAGQRKAPPRIAALFSGSSGTGKTLAAHWLAGSLDVDVFRVDLGQVVKRYIGETEKNLEAAFRDAQQSGSVLLFDEADALFGKRSEVKDGHDRYANLDVNDLLQRIESFAGVAILTTHSSGWIDPAVLARFKVVAFPIPPH